MISRIFLLIGIFAITACGEPESPESKEQRTCLDKRLSYYYAQDFIKSKLKAPSTADFPSFSSISYEYQGNCTHHLSGYVDAQNAFGAMIRNHYEIVVRYKKGTATYYMDSLTFQ